MKRLTLFVIVPFLSCMPGGCQQKMAEKVSEKVGEQIVEKALESQMRKEGKSGKVDIGSVNLKGEAKELAPPDFYPKFLTETEDGFIMAGLVRGKTQKEIEDFYVSKLGKPSGRFVMGNQLHLSYENTYIAIHGKSGSIEVYVMKGKKAKERMNR